MDMKICAAAAAVFAAGIFGGMGAADAATGVVNVQAVLADNAAFQSIQQSMRKERAAMQRDFAEKAKTMNQEQKLELAKTYRMELTKKEQEAMNPLNERMKKAVEKAAKEKQIDTVVAAGGLMYGSIDADLTQDVKANMK